MLTDNNKLYFRSFADVNKPLKVVLSLEESVNEIMPKKNTFCSLENYYLVVGKFTDNFSYSKDHKSSNVITYDNLYLFKTTFLENSNNFFPFKFKLN